MVILDIAAGLISLAAIFSYINYRFIKFPMTIGLMIFSLGLSLLIIVVNLIFPGVQGYVKNIIAEVDFNLTLMHGMLAFLLFAGALHVDFNDLQKRKVEVGVLSTLGVLLSTVIVGGLVYALSNLFTLQLEFIHCLLFGALISPTDPIAVMGVFKQASAPKTLEIKLKGESLFNDGIGVVVFLVILSIAFPIDGHSDTSIMGAMQLLAVEAIGGIAFGIVAGWLAFRMLKSVDNYSVEILITLALVIGGFTLANHLHTSGPLAIVVAGLLIGNQGRQYAMSDKTRAHLDTFWELIDEILNAVLFVLIGLEVLVVSLNGQYLLAGLIAIPLVLLSRFISVGIPISIMRLNKTYTNNVVRIMTWGGLRGGISVALALSLPPGPQRDVILTITYMIVTFSIIVQGLTLKLLIRKSRNNNQNGAEVT